MGTTSTQRARLGQHLHTVPDWDNIYTPCQTGTTSTHRARLGQTTSTHKDRSIFTSAVHRKRTGVWLTFSKPLSDMSHTEMIKATSVCDRSAYHSKAVPINSEVFLCILYKFLSQWEFPHRKFGSLSPRKASCNSLALPNPN